MNHIRLRRRINVKVELAREEAPHKRVWHDGCGCGMEAEEMRKPRRLRETSDRRAIKPKMMEEEDTQRHIMLLA